MKKTINLVSGNLLITDPHYVQKDLKRQSPFIHGQDRFTNGCVASGLEPGNYDVAQSIEGGTITIKLTPIAAQTEKD